MASNDIPYISHHDTTNYPLLVSTNESGSWATETVDTPRIINTRLDSGIALDNNNLPHIVINDNSIYSVSITEMNQFGAFDTFILDTSLYDDTFFSVENAIGVDSQGDTHVLYHGDLNNLMYATNASGTWEIELLKDDACDVYMPLVLDENDTIHTTCNEVGSGLMYYTNASGSWVTDLIDANGFDANYLALDQDHKVHIAYMHNNGDLYYATNESGPWESILIDDGFIFEYSLDTDSSGVVHMTYYDNTVDEFYYVIIIDGIPTYETLYGNVDARWDQLRVDEDDYVHSIWERGSHTNYTNDMTGDMVTTEEVVPGSPARFDIDEDNDQLHFVFQLNWGLWYAVVPKGYVNQ